MSGKVDLAAREGASTHASVASATPVLEVSQAAKRLGGRPALDGLSLSIGAGELYSLIGPNGAGKTTLVRCICRRYALDRGRILVRGKDPMRNVEARRSIGLVPQSIALYPELSVRENLEIFGRLSGVREELRTSVQEALRWTELESRATERVSNLSGGMQRRLNLAAATLHDPELLILDEPTVGIDPRARQGIHELLLRFKERGLAILLTTHDLEQAEELADRVGVLIDGRLRAEGSLEELIGSAFGAAAKEVQVTLSQAPDDDGIGTLTHEGLHGSGDGRTWSGPLQGGLDELASLGVRLAEAGFTVDEFRVREPSLRGVFLQLTGQEMAS